MAVKTFEQIGRKPLGFDEIGQEKPRPFEDITIEPIEPDFYSRTIADPSGPPTARPAEPERHISDLFLPQLREQPLSQTTEAPGSAFAAPLQQTGWQKFKKFFVGDRPPLPPNADRIEKINRVVNIMAGAPVRTFIKYGKGKLLNTPDLMWAAVKKVTPDSLWDSEVKKMNLDQAMDWAMNYDPAAFTRAAGGIAEFIGRLQTAKGIGQATGILSKELPKDIGTFGKAVELGKLGLISGTAEQVSEGLAQAIDPETKYPYEGASGVIKEGLILAAFSLGKSLAIDPIAKSAVGRQIIIAADKYIARASQKYPRLFDALRRNPSEENLNMLKKGLWRPVKDIESGIVREMKVPFNSLSPKQQALVRNAARAIDTYHKRIWQAYMRQPTPDVVYPGTRPVGDVEAGTAIRKLLPAGRPIVAPTRPTQPIAPAKPAEGKVEKPSIEPSRAKRYERVIKKLQTGKYKGRIQAADYANVGIRRFQDEKMASDLGLGTYALERLLPIKITEQEGWDLPTEPTVEEFKAAIPRIEQYEELKQKQFEANKKGDFESAVKFEEQANKLLAPPAPAAKEAWEMTLTEYKDYMDKQLEGKAVTSGWTREGFDYNNETRHRTAVVNRIKQGKPVPRHVLEEYKSEKWAQEALKPVAKPKSISELKTLWPNMDFENQGGLIVPTFGVSDEFRREWIGSAASTGGVRESAGRLHRELLKRAKPPVIEKVKPAPLRKPVKVSDKLYHPVTLPTESIGVDPERFQFKLEAKLRGGITEAMKEVQKWDPIKGGTIFVWRDKAGKHWVIDGHHRVALARKTGQPEIDAWVVREDDGWSAADARATGALLNLSYGKGTAIDAAKLFRDSDISLAELRKEAVPTNNTIVQQGLEMKKLSDGVFRLVIDGKLPANMAAAIGRNTKGPTQQMQVAKMITEGQVDTLRQAELLSMTIDSAPVLTKSEQTLFGLETTEKSLYAERAKVLANVEKKLKINKKVFGTLARKSGIIEAKGNILARMANLTAEQQAKEMLFILEKFANAKGPVAEALNDATKKYAENPTPKALAEASETLIQRWSQGPEALRVQNIEAILTAPTKGPEPAIDLGIYADKVPPTDVPTKIALQNAVTKSLNQDAQKALNAKKAKRKFKELKNEKALYEKEYANKPELFINPNNPMPEMRAAWTIATKGKGLFGGQITRGGFIDVRALAQVHKAVINILEPAKPAEIKYGKEVVAAVMKGIHNVDVARIEFNEEQIESMDRTLGEYAKLLGKYSNATLTNLMIARGKPKAPEAIALQKKALEELAKETPELIGVRKMITRIGDFTHKYLQRVAGDEVKYVEDYYYGIYKDAKKVRRWLDYFTTTKRFLKEKKWFTVAEAMAVGKLELRDPNPVHNIRSEYMAIARLDGMILMRDELLKLGKDKFISENPALLAEPEKIPEPVFRGLYVDEPLARLIKSLISTSKINKVPALNNLRRFNNVARTVKFTMSMFHHLSVLKQSIVDSGYLGFLLPNKWVGIHKRPGKTIPYGIHKGTAARGFTLGFRTNDPIFKTKFYRRYVKNGGSHRYSIESEAQRMITNSVDRLNSKIGKPLKAAMFVPQIPVRYVKWMFQSYIPKVKYMKTADEYNKRAKKLGRDLTDAELQEIIKEGQNFYGMMNERLFGRSGTVTQLLRVRFMSPGYWEGNIRSIVKGFIQWGGKQFNASRSRANILNSFLFTAIAATIGTLIMTRKPPKKPETLKDIRDLFKIDTGWVDARGNKIMVDLMTYDKDYWNVYGKLLTGQAGEIPGDVLRRIGGMGALSFDVLSDLNQMAMGKAIYNWKGDKVTEITDPFLQRIGALVWHEFQKAEPISINVYTQARKKDLSRLASAFVMLAGARLTKTEKAKREQQILTRIFSLFDRQESLYYYLGTIKNPREHIERYNRIVNSIFDNPITTAEMRKKYYKGRIIDVDRLLENKAHYLTSPKRTPEEIEKTRKYLENFDVTPAQAQEYLNRYWARERITTPVSPLERDRVIGRKRKRERLKKRMQE